MQKSGPSQSSTSQEPVLVLLPLIYNGGVNNSVPAKWKLTVQKRQNDILRAHEQFVKTLKKISRPQD